MFFTLRDPSNSQGLLRFTVFYDPEIMADRGSGIMAVESWDCSSGEIQALATAAASGA
jgi:hypothetical protein